MYASSKQNREYVYFLLLQINRIILQEEDRVKQETEAAKLPVDYTTLQLNNLLYQKNHYIKAINACKDFKSKYPDIELVPEEEFFQNAPLEFQNDPDLRNDAHKMMLERLNYELHQVLCSPLCILCGCNCFILDGNK
jgi:THO complex subunit 5